MNSVNLTFIRHYSQTLICLLTGNLITLCLNVLLNFYLEYLMVDQQDFDSPSYSYNRLRHNSILHQNCH